MRSARPLGDYAPFLYKPFIYLFFSFFFFFLNFGHFVAKFYYLLISRSMELVSNARGLPGGKILKDTIYRKYTNRPTQKLQYY